MMKSRRQQREYLKSLLKCSPQDRKGKVATGRDAEVRFLSECALNLLQGNIPVSASQKRSLCRYKTTLRKVSAPKRSHTYRRKLFSQTGNGFWLALLPAAISAITSLIR